MKFSYALLKKLLPRLPKAPVLAARLNSYSFEVEEVKGDLLDVKLPANLYSYASSHVGLAREVAVIFGLPFKHQVTRIVNLPEKRGRLAAEVQDKNCLRYAARYFEIPKMAKTPKEIRDVLATCGINSINYVVDITNYAMLETGQPLHAFDAEKISFAKNGKARQIVVRKARKGERLVTLDKKSVELTPEILVVADASKPLSLAGIKGGFDSGITAATRVVILEAAAWDGVTTYKAAQKLGIQTDASIRFSHDLSPALVDWGMDRATELMKKAGAKLIDSVDHYPRPAGDGIIDFDPERYEQLVGAPILISDAARALKSLGFIPNTAMKKGGGMLRVRVPAWRNDIENFEDLVEEVARLAGYNELPKQAPRVTLQTVEEDAIFVLKDRIRGLLPRLGLDEIYTSSFVGEAELAAPENILLRGPADGLVELANPIADDKKYLRPSLAPLLLAAVSGNSRYYDSVRMFEVGKTFRRRSGGVHEALSLGIALGARKDPKRILELKEIVAEFFRGEGLPDFEFREERDGLLVLAAGEPCGELRLYSLEREWVAAVAEVNLRAVMHAKKTGSSRFTPLPKYPATYRDVSALVAPSVRVSALIEAIRKQADFAERVELIDEYADAKFGGRKSYAFRITFRAADRTLTGTEVSEAMLRVSGILASQFHAEIR